MFNKEEEKEEDESARGQSIKVLALLGNMLSWWGTRRLLHSVVFQYIFETVRTHTTQKK
jgi:hypothetical protein